MLISSKLRPEKVVQVFKPPFLSQLFSFLLVHQIFTSWPSSIFPLHPRLHTDFCIYLHKHKKQEIFYQKEDLLIETKSFSLKLLNQRMWLKSTRTKIRQMFLQNFDILNVNTILWIFSFTNKTWESRYFFFDLMTQCWSRCMNDIMETDRGRDPWGVEGERKQLWKRLNIHRWTIWCIVMF